MEGFKFPLEYKFSNLSGLVNASDAVHFRAQIASVVPNQSGLGERNMLWANARTSEIGAIRQLEEVALERSKIPGNAC